MNFFADVMFNGPMVDNLNFKSVPSSAVSLFVMHTGNYFYELSNAVAS